MPRKVSILLLVIVVAVIAVVLVRRTGEHGSLAVPKAEASLVETKPVDLARTTGDQQRREQASPAPDPQLAVDTAQGPTLPHLIVRVVAKETGRPVRAVHVSLFPEEFEEGFSSTSVEVSKGTMHESLRPDEKGEADFAVPCGKGLRLTVSSEEHQASLGEQEVSALAAGERRVVRVEVATEDDLEYHGRVVSLGGGAPVSGARIEAIRAQMSLVGIENEAPHREWSREKLADAISDSDGYFGLNLATWKGPHLRVEANGFALTLRIPRPGHESRGTAEIIALDAAASVNAQVFDRSGAAIAGAWVLATAKAHSFDRSDDPTGLAWAFASLPDEQWRAESGPDGRCTLSNLPPTIPLQVEIRQKGRVLRREADPLTLKPGEVRELDLRIGTGCTLSGQVLDQSGKPVSNQELWIQKPIGEFERYFEPHSDDQVVARASTDSEGHFSFADVAAGKWWIGPAARRRLGESATDGAIAPLARVVEVGPTPSQELTLHVYRDLFIRGKVVDPLGDPVLGCFVHADQGEGFLHLTAMSETGGTFVLGPMGAGVISLHASSMREGAPSAVVSAEAGQSDVILRMRPGGSFSGRVVDARTGGGCAAELMWTLEQGGADDFRSTTMSWAGTDGSFSEAGLEPGQYGLAARTMDGHFGVLAGVGIGPDRKTSGLVLSVSPGGTLRLRYEGAKPYVMFRVTSGGVPVGWPDSLEQGKAIEKPAPAGSMDLEVRMEPPGPARLIHIELQPGEKKDVVIRDDQ